MRIEQRKAATGGEVLQKQGEKQCRLAGAGLADHVQVATPVLDRECDRRVNRKADRGGTEHEWFIRGHGSAPEPVCFLLIAGGGEA